jgi:hypothetical protein
MSRIHNTERNGDEEKGERREMADLVWRLQLTSGPFETDRIPGDTKEKTTSQMF